MPTSNNPIPLSFFFLVNPQRACNGNHQIFLMVASLPLQNKFRLRKHSHHGQTDKRKKTDNRLMRTQSEKMSVLSGVSLGGLTPDDVIVQHCYYTRLLQYYQLGYSIVPKVQQFGGHHLEAGSMRFEAHLKRDKIKPLEPILAMIIALIKCRECKYSLYMIYVAAQNQIRILIQSEIVPIVIVLAAEHIITKLISVSKNQTSNSSIGFQFKKGLSFLEHLLICLRENDSFVLAPEEEKTLVLKIAKEKDFRAFQFKSKTSTLKEQIQKPNKNENELFTYEWIDGVVHSQVCLEFNPTIITQMLKVASKVRNHHMIQELEEKKLVLIMDISNAKVTLKLKTQSSPFEFSGKFSKIEGSADGKYFYQIKIEDAQLLMLAIRNECMFVIDDEKNLSVSYTSLFYNCQISLKHLALFVAHEGIDLESRGMLKREM